MVEAVSFCGQTEGRCFRVYLSGTRSETAALDSSEHLSCERHRGEFMCQGKTDERRDEQEIR